MAKRSPSVVPEPIASLFQGMADSVPGVLSVLSVTKAGRVRMSYLVRPSPPLEFTLFARRPHDRFWLVEVRVAKDKTVLVSPIPSAVMAVALR